MSVVWSNALWNGLEVGLEYENMVTVSDSTRLLRDDEIKDFFRSDQAVGDMAFQRKYRKGTDTTTYAFTDAKTAVLFKLTFG